MSLIRIVIAALALAGCAPVLTSCRAECQINGNCPDGQLCVKGKCSDLYGRPVK